MADVTYATTGFYVNPGSMIAIAVIFPVLAIISVVGRFVVRRRYDLTVKADDWLCVPALVCVVATGALYIYAVKEQNLGTRLSPDSTPAQTKTLTSAPAGQQLRVIEYAANIMMALSTGLIRLSFLFFYQRIFRGRAFSIVHWTMVAITVAWTISMIVTYFTICPYYLKPHLTDKHLCPPMLVFLGAYAITGFALDLAILSLPFPWLTKRQIWRLQLPISQKWAVTSVFLCGSFAVAASCVRMVSGIEVLLDKPGVYSNLVGLKSYGDVLGGAGVWLFWSYVENGTGLVVCCLPSLAPFLRKRVAKTPSPYSSDSRPTGPLSLSSGTANSGFAPRNEYQEDSDHDGEKPRDSILVTHTVDQYRVPV